MFCLYPNYWTIFRINTNHYQRRTWIKTTMKILSKQIIHTTMQFQRVCRPNNSIKSKFVKIKTKNCPSECEFHVVSILYPLLSLHIPEDILQNNQYIMCTMDQIVLLFISKSISNNNNNQWNKNKRVWSTQFDPLYLP